MTLTPHPLRSRRDRPAPIDPISSTATLFARITAPDEVAGTDDGARVAEAEATLEAIGAGEVDSFVVSGRTPHPRVFSLSTADRPYRLFVENMRDGVATVSSRGVILYANHRLAELLACPREFVVGSPLPAFLGGGVPVGVDELLGPHGHGTTLELDLIDASGQAVPVRVGTSVLESEGEPLLCVTFADMSAQRAQDDEIARLSKAQAERLADLQNAQRALTRQATHDALTGLPNRALLVDRIDQALVQSRESGRFDAVLFVDLDRFKQINDTQGHAVGDAVLRRTAARLLAALGPIDTVARIGGDEFVVLAPNLDHAVRAIDLSARLVRSLHQRTDGIPDEEQVTASVGIAVAHRGSGSAESLLHEADTAMYHAKSLGGGRSELFDAALGRDVRQRSTAQRMLQSVLDDERVILHYQPIIDLGTGHVAGFEALARITALDGSILPPSEFIPVAEECGLVVPLGTHVLGLACREARQWPAAASDVPVTVAVNLASRQFEPGDLAAIVRRLLEQSDLDPQCLHLELTETAVIDLHPDLPQQLGRIRDLGVQVGLDDFGTGYASLTHLRRLPLTFVKIDQTFVQGLGADEDDERVVSAVVDLASRLGLRSIAEGIETEDQLQRLRSFGCDQGQGYLFARPLPPSGVPAVLQHAAW